LTWAEAAWKPADRIPISIPGQKPNPTLSIHPSADPDFDWYHWINAESPPPGLPSPKGFGHTYQVDPLNPPSTSGYAPGPPPPEPEHKVVTPSPPSSNLGSPKAPEDEVAPGPPSSPSADSQQVDLQAAIYAAKGKAKVSRRISGTATDVGNAA